YSPRCSITNLTARSRTTGSIFFGMTTSSQPEKTRQQTRDGSLANADVSRPPPHHTVTSQAPFAPFPVERSNLGGGRCRDHRKELQLQ
ncbi:MAG: hypothetical protein LKI58_13355, partial [Actinomyces sp.]